MSQFQQTKDGRDKALLGGSRSLSADESVRARLPELLGDGNNCRVKEIAFFIGLEVVFSAPDLSKDGFQGRAGQSNIRLDFGYVAPKIRVCFQLFR